MSQKRKLDFVNVGEDFERTRNKIETNWELCVLCQEDRSDSLVCPAVSKRSDVGAGYATLVKDLKAFLDEDVLPDNLKRLCDVSEDEFHLKLAKFHKDCRSKYNKWKLDRLVKRKTIKTEILTESPANNTRTSFSAENVQGCIFCEDELSNVALLNVGSLEVSERVKEGAIILSDSKLLAKLSCGDMIATQSKYHKKCLVQFYNKVRQASKTDNQECKEKDLYYGIALNELISYLKEKLNLPDVKFAFKLADLKTLMIRRIAAFGYEHPENTVHSTRLKEQILAYMPELQAQTVGRDIVFLHKKIVKEAIANMSENGGEEGDMLDGMVLSKTAKIIRKEMFSREFKNFNGDFGKNCQTESIPRSLLTLIKMILEGPDIEIEEEMNDSSNAALSISQLIRFNSKSKRSQKNLRHSKNNETPLPLYLGLMIHARTRKKSIIDRLHKLGLSVSYDRVQEIFATITNKECENFMDENAVCPVGVGKNIFTCAAIDNIDHNPSSNMSEESFHGTAISLIQNISGDISVPTLSIKNDEWSKKCYGSLPDWYLDLPETPSKKPEVPFSTVNFQELNSEKSNPLKNEWLKMIGASELDSLEKAQHLNWASFYSQQKPDNFVRSRNILLPLLHESINSTAMVRHCFDIIQVTLHSVNPNQAAVITCDQPVYAIGKQLQWSLPEFYGEDKIVLMMGGLHIEMAFEVVIGDWLKESGWTDLVVEANVTSEGKANQCLKASHVKRTRYVHEVSMASLFILLQKAYKSSSNCDKITFEDWVSQRVTESTQFNYWYTVLKLQAIFFFFLHSVRTANFENFISSLEQMASWMFALDHTNYARWLPVFIKTLKELKVRHPSVYEEFKKGAFVGNKTGKCNSYISHDQMHEQCNKEIKIDGGAVGIFHNPSALIKWMVSGPVVSNTISQFENEFGYFENLDIFNHHDDTRAMNNRFLKDTKELISVFLKDDRNPFSHEENYLMNIASNEILDNESINSIKIAEKLGEEQYNTFMRERLVECKTPLSDPIHRNKLKLFSKNNTKTSANSKKLTVLKNDRSLFTRLYIACQDRESDLNDFFAHENLDYPPSISDGGMLRKGNKSDVVSCLEKTVSPSGSDRSPASTCQILDGAVIIHMLKPDTATTFKEYSMNRFQPYIMKLFSKSDRIDVVFDRYISDSLKSEERLKRGQGPRIHVKGSTKIPKNWPVFLQNEQNKNELFQFLASDFLGAKLKKNHTLVLTKDTDVFFIPTRFSACAIRPCLQEEADTRMMLHARHASYDGHKKVTIRTVDSDVVVLAVHAYSELDLEQLWIEFGTGKNHRLIPIHDIVSTLGNEIASGIPFWHAITGSDTTSSFNGHGKKTFWEVWQKNKKFGSTFTALTKQPKEVTEEIFLQIQKFIISAFDKSSRASSVNECRKNLVTKKNKALENVPPTEAALMEQVKRSVFQAGYVWSQWSELQPNLPRPEDWGWKRTANGGFEPVWTNLPSASKSCKELVKCGCKSLCTFNCKCAKLNLPCTGLCYCDGQCYRQENFLE